MSLGSQINRLIELNIEIWHQAVKIKLNGKPRRDMPTKDRINTFLTIRKLNAERSKVRWTIDKDGPNETKINYLGADKC